MARKVIGIILICVFWGFFLKSCLWMDVPLGFSIIGASIFTMTLVWLGLVRPYFFQTKEQREEEKLEYKIKSKVLAEMQEDGGPDISDAFIDPR